MHHSRNVHLRLGTAKFFRGDGFTGDLLDHLRPGDKHPALLGLDNEIGKRRTVGRSSRAGSANQRDLRNRSRKHDIVVKDAAISGQAVDALLNARAARVVDKDERTPGFEREAHHIGNLVAMRLAGSSACDGKILASQMHQAPVDVCASGHHSVGRHFLFGHPEIGCAMSGEESDLFEAAPIHQPCDSFPRGQLAGRVLRVDALLAAAEFGLGTPCVKLGNLIAERLLLWNLFLLSHSCS